MTNLTQAELSHLGFDQNGDNVMMRKPQSFHTDTPTRVWRQPTTSVQPQVVARPRVPVSSVASEFKYGDPVTFMREGHILTGVCDMICPDGRIGVVYADGAAWGACLVSTATPAKNRERAIKSALTYCEREMASQVRHRNDPMAQLVYMECAKLMQYLTA